MKSALLIALSILTALGSSAPVFGQVKGAEKLAGSRLANVGAPAAAMSCPTEIRTVRDASARGAFKTVAIYSAHLCPSCEDQEVVQGAGKLATHKIVHTCKMTSGCCIPKS